MTGLNPSRYPLNILDEIQSAPKQAVIEHIRMRKSTGIIILQDAFDSIHKHVSKNVFDARKKIIEAQTQKNEPETNVLETTTLHILHDSQTQETGVSI